MVEAGITCIIPAAMYTKISSKSNAADEEEKGVECVHYQRQDRHDNESFIDSRGNEVNEGKHREHCDEHAVVDDRGVASDGVCDHVSDKCHYEECPEELGHVWSATQYRDA